MPDFFVNKADFERAVAERLAPLNQEIEALKNNRNQILAEKKALEGKTTGTTPEGVVRTATHIHVPREIARDASRYQSFKALAQEEGLVLSILEAPIERTDEKMPSTYTNDRMHYVSKAYIGSDGALYRKEKEFADSKGLTMTVVHHASELPKEAFLKE